MPDLAAPWRVAVPTQGDETWTRFAGAATVTTNAITWLDAVAAATGARFWSAVLGPLEEEGRFGPEDAPVALAFREGRAAGFTTEAVERLLRALGRSSQRLVVFVDELDYLVRGYVPAQDGFFTGLRSLLGGTHRALSLVVSSREQLAVLEEHWRKKGGGGSPPFNIYTQILLGPLGEADVDAVLDAPGAGLSPEDRRFVHAISGGYAAIVQHAAASLFATEAADPAERLRRADSALLLEASRMLTDVWARWPPAVRRVFATVAVEHLGALGPAIGWEQGPVSAVDAASFPEEIHVLGRHGFIASSPGTPGGYVVLPLLFLAWFAVKLRQGARSPAEWSRWMDLEDWTGDLRSLFETTVRVRAPKIRPDISTLLAAHAGLSSPPFSKRFPPLVAKHLLPSSLVLHLSDLHFGTTADAELWYGQLAEDLHALHATQLDAVILSGDLTNRSATAEYEATALFVARLRAELQLSPAQIIPVPGNHDLDWGISRSAYRLVGAPPYRGALERGAWVA